MEVGKGALVSLLGSGDLTEGDRDGLLIIIVKEKSIRFQKTYQSLPTIVACRHY